jgi:glycosyltransferase involved in cell wall biosynthesis
VADAAVRRLVPAMVLPLRGDLVLQDALTFAKFLRREKPDALLLGTFKKIWLGGIAGSRAGVERLVARVGLESDVPRRFKYRYALRHWIDTVVLNAESMRAEFQGREPRFDPGRIVTIHTGVKPRPPQKTRGQMRQSIGIPVDAPVVGTIARLARQKRLDRLLEALRLTRDLHCVIAGDGSEQAMLEDLVRQKQLAERVHFLGHREDVADVLVGLDLFVITSDREGMSNSMLQALAAGVPVVSTAVSGAQEALQPLADGRKPGVVVDFAPETIARELQRLVSDRETLAEMSKAAAEAAALRFDYERMLLEWEVVLRGGASALRTLPK